MIKFKFLIEELLKNLKKYKKLILIIKKFKYKIKLNILNIFYLTIY